jgi:hypothetical protein
MILHDLFEADARTDIRSAKTASDLVNGFRRWLGAENEERPIKDVMSLYHVGGEDMWYVEASKFGGPSDLWFGLSYGSVHDEHTEGFLRPLRNTQTGQAIYAACLRIKADPANEIDFAYSFSQNQMAYLVHEVTHYFDYKRRKGPRTKSPKTQSGTTAYYNDPLEFNAFFQQGVHTVLASLKTMRPSREFFTHFETYDNFYATFKMDFDESFRANLTPEMRKKFDVRVYKLWEVLKERVRQVQPDI